MSRPSDAPPPKPPDQPQQQQKPDQPQQFDAKSFTDRFTDQKSAPKPDDKGPSPKTGSSGTGAQVRQNAERGNRAADSLQKLIEQRTDPLQREVTTKGGKGGSRVDIAPDSKQSGPTIGRTIESKSRDLDKYRVNTDKPGVSAVVKPVDANALKSPNGTLDVPKIKEMITKDVGQVVKHQEALRQGIKPDLPMRETIVYTLEHATQEEAGQFQQIFRETAKDLRGLSKESVVQGGVLYNSEGFLRSASGRALMPIETGTAVEGAGRAAVTEGALSKGEIGLLIVSSEAFKEFIGAATGLDLEARARNSDVFHMTSEQRATLLEQRRVDGQKTEFENAVTVQMQATGSPREVAEAAVRTHRADVAKDVAAAKAEHPGMDILSEPYGVPPPQQSWYDQLRQRIFGRWSGV